MTSVLFYTCHSLYFEGFPPTKCLLQDVLSVAQTPTCVLFWSPLPNRVFFSPVPGRVFQCKLHLLPGTLATHHSLGKTERFTSQDPQKLPLSLTLELRACKHWTRHRKPLPLPALHSVRLEKKKKKQKAMQLTRKIQSVEEKRGCDWKDSRDDAWNDVGASGPGPLCRFWGSEKEHSQERNSANPMKYDSSNLPKLELPHSAPATSSPSFSAL